MRLVIVGKEDLVYYEDMIPVIYKNYLELPSEIVVGAAEEDEDGGYVACGVMILSVADPAVVELRWLQVHPDYQEKEIGTILLRQAFLLAKKLKAQRIEARVPEVRGESPMFDTRSSFFIMRGFVRQSVIKREWIFSKKEIKNSKLKGLKATRGKIISYENLSKDELEAKMLRIINEKTMMPLVPGLVDRELSMSYVSGGKLLADIVIQKVGGVYHPIYFHVTDDPQAGLELIATLLRELKKKLKPTNLVHIECDSEEQRDAVEKLFDEIEAVNVCVFEATPDAFDNADAAMQEEIRLFDEVKKEDAEFPTRFKVVELEYYGGETETFE